MSALPTNLNSPGVLVVSGGRSLGALCNTDYIGPPKLCARCPAGY